MDRKELSETLALLSCLEHLANSLVKFHTDLMLLGREGKSENSCEMLSSASKRFRDELIEISLSLKDACFEINTHMSRGSETLEKD